MGKLKDPNIKRICVVCGTEYHPNSSRQMCCNLPKDRVCPICGKTFQVLCKPNNKGPKTCSKECSDKLIAKNREASASTITKICKACGKEFHPKSVRDLYCSEPHFKKCAVCGALFEYDVRKSDTPKTCSSECRYKLALENRDFASEHKHQVETLIRKYGVTNSAFVPGAMEKTISTNRERYGVDYYTQTYEYKNRVYETDMKNYGVSHHASAKSVINKRINNLVESKGVSNVFQLDDVKKKSRKTLLEKTGYEYASQIPEVKEKVKNTNLDRYGETHAMKLQEYKDKSVQTTLEKYGREYYTQRNIKDIDAWYEFISDPRKYISTHYDNPPRTSEIAEDLGVDSSTVSEYISASNAGDCVSRAKSLMEIEILKFIKALNPNLRVYNNDKSVIYPMELDIYIPDYNFAIECNPTCTHNSSFIDPWGGQSKSRLYHAGKSKRCMDNGVFLMHIFGYEWTHSKDIILSMITNRLHCNADKIYARKCDIREVNSKTSRKFLNMNHRQGYTNAKVNIGLFYNNNLVSLMTFGKMRNSVGTGNEDLSDCWELVRFCSLLNTSVIGGADKLFRYFLRNYNPSRVRSFSDVAHTDGNLYRTLGFEYKHMSDPSYVWVNVKTDVGYHRYNAQKRNLKRFLKDNSIDLSKTEKQIMEEHGFAQVYDSGTILWEYVNN